MKRYQKNLIASLLFTLTGCASSGNVAPAVAPQSEDQPAEAATVPVAAENAKVRLHSQMIRRTAAERCFAANAPNAMPQVSSRIRSSSSNGAVVMRVHYIR